MYRYSGRGVVTCPDSGTVPNSTDIDHTVHPDTLHAYGG